jgi:16S rRNA (cytosine967-C5)-methyltransferase
MLKPGGRLVYAVCSLQLDEGPIRMRTALKLGLNPAPFTEADAIGVTEALTPDGYLRTSPALWPLLGGMDGFFIARFVKG